MMNAEQNAAQNSQPKAPDIPAKVEPSIPASSVGASQKRLTIDRFLTVSNGLILLGTAVITMFVTALSPIGGYLKDQFEQSKVFSEKMNGAIEVLSSSDDKKAAITLVTLYPLAKSKEEKKLLIRMALLNNSNSVLETLSELVGKDQVAKEIISSEEISALIRGAGENQEVPINVMPVKQANFANSRQFGDAGWDIADLQQLLLQAGYLAPPATGYFGINTERAIKVTQKISGLPPDGIAGPATVAVLESIPTQGPLPLAGSGSLFGSSFGIPDYKDSSPPDTNYRTTLLRQAVISGQTGWIYLGTLPESSKQDGPVTLTGVLAVLFEDSQIDLVSYYSSALANPLLRITTAKDVYLRRDRPQAARLANVMGVLMQGSQVSIQETWVFRATNAESRVWAKVRVESIPFQPVSSEEAS